MPHPRYLLKLLTSEEVSEWLVYMAREPIGEDRADLRAAMLMALIANRHRDSKREPRPYVPKMFIHDFWNGELSPEDTENQLLMMFGAFNGNSES